ncbi:hypothetical protein RvY_08594 [Ramazzottius varieornatus]|uniref:Uncharacterized protein n=1 Tax=Ramazzottius varieornatus TaxID=947166 RepID=A0A1D1VFL8_RAMVA|nr:hypothetical protein RvY_08594 [Ramazzottius varieornatus]
MFVLENSDVYGTARGAAARAFCLFFNNWFDPQHSVSVENHHQNRRAVTQVNGQLKKQLNRFTCAECRPAYFYTRQANGNISIPVDLLRPSRITYLKDSGNLFYGTEELY